jgi:hypothetical protein
MSRTVIARVIDGELLSPAEWNGFGRYAETPPARETLEQAAEFIRRLEQASAHAHGDIVLSGATR